MIVDEPDYDIRYTEAEDEDFVKRILEDPHVRKEFPAETESELQGFIPNWVGFYRFKSSITAIYKGENVGLATLLLMPYQKLFHHCMCYVVVDPKWQGQGIGTSLVRNLKHLARDYFRYEKIYAEFYEGSKIDSILRKQGFADSLRQEKYVKEDGQYRARIQLEVNL